MTRAVHAAGRAGARRCSAEVTLDGRLRRRASASTSTGPTLLQLTRAAAARRPPRRARSSPALGLVRPPDRRRRRGPPPCASWMDTATCRHSRRHCSPKHGRHRHPRACSTACSARGTGCAMATIRPENVIMTADGPRLIDLDLFDPRACGPSIMGTSTFNLTELCLARHPQSAAAPLAVRRRLVRNPKTRGLSGMPAAGGAEAKRWKPWAADRDRPPLPAYGRADKRAMAADDAERRSGPAPAGLTSLFIARAWPSMCGRSSASALGQIASLWPSADYSRSSPVNGRRQGEPVKSEKCQ